MKEIRHKAIVIPVAGNKFLTVKDSRHQEWIFVTGGCKKSELQEPLRCGLRELEEETRGTISIKAGEYSTFEFESLYRSPEELRNDRIDGIIVTLMYHVYIIQVCISSEDQKKVIRTFHRNRERMNVNKINGVRIKKAYDENDDISFDTLDEFRAKRRWKMITENILDNPEFYKALEPGNKQVFNIRTIVNDS